MRGIIGIALLLTACQSDESERDTQAMIAAESDNHLRTIAVLEERIAASEADIKQHSQTIESLQAQLEILAKVIDENAEIANGNTVRQMTQNGDCGTRLHRDENGTYRNQKIPCTADDLRR